MVSVSLADIPLVIITKLMTKKETGGILNLDKSVHSVMPAPENLGILVL